MVLVMVLLEFVEIAIFVFGGVDMVKGIMGEIIHEVSNTKAYPK